MTKLNLTGDVDSDIEVLLTALDNASLSWRQSLAVYSEYLSSMAAALADRSRQVGDEGRES